MTLVNRSRADLRARSSSPVSYRADIDGLRALAIALVVVYHVWFGRVSGGVDVFLMISAYFMTASFARRATQGATEPVLGYWTRRFARLLPAAVVTMLGILAMVAVVFPASSWQEVWRQTWASLFYFQNWELLASTADYYDRNNVSPLQHFWSLSIQGQVFVIWPLLMLAAVAVGRAASVRVTRALTYLFAVVFVFSLAYSVLATNADQQSAYFNTFARLWEFALGSLLALIVPHVRLSRVPAVVLGWVGITGLVVCGALLDVQGGFPGYLALWPTLSAAAVILAGSTAAAGGPTRFLASAPLRRLAAIAYALYLVHWPVLVTWLVVTERTSVGLAGGVFIIGISVALAFLITYAVERPLQRLTAASVRRATAMIVACIAAVAIVLVSWQTYESYRASLPVGDHPGARILLPGGEDLPVDSDDIVPFGAAIDAEWVDLGAECSEALRPRSEVLRATCSERAAGWRSTATVLVIGDSHAQQWMGALLPIAEQRNWTVVALLKGGCSFAEDEEPLDGVDDCEEWREAAFSYALEHTPDLLFGMATKSVAESPDERTLRGIEAYLEPIAENGTEVVLVRDNPRFDIDMFVCIELNGADADECRRTAGDVLAADNPAAWLGGDRIIVLDFTPFLCPDGVCESVIGAVAVYLDHGHIGGTYAETLSWVLTAEADDVLQRVGR